MSLNSITIGFQNDNNLFADIIITRQYGNRGKISYCTVNIMTLPNRTVIASGKFKTIKESEQAVKSIDSLINQYKEVNR